METKLRRCKNPECRKALSPIRDTKYLLYCSTRCYNRAKYLSQKLKMKADKSNPPQKTMIAKVFGNGRRRNILIARLSPEKFGARVDMVLKEIYGGN